MITSNETNVSSIQVDEFLGIVQEAEAEEKYDADGDDSDIEGT